MKEWEKQFWGKMYRDWLTHRVRRDLKKWDDHDEKMCTNIEFLLYKMLLAYLDKPIEP